MVYCNSSITEYMLMMFLSLFRAQELLPSQTLCLNHLLTVLIVQSVMLVGVIVAVAISAQISNIIIF